MYKKIISGTVAAIAMTVTASAFAAEGWGIKHEKITRAEVKVVDLLCEITGDCPAKCGAGKRQLGILFDDGKLVPVVKSQTIFAGAVADLLPHCGKRIVADGLMINNPKMRMFMLQFSRAAYKGQKLGPWSGARQFGKDWSKANGGKPADEWFRHDGQIKAAIKKDGVLGIPGLKPPE